MSDMGMLCLGIFIGIWIGLPVGGEVENWLEERALRRKYGLRK